MAEPLSPKPRVTITKTPDELRIVIPNLEPERAPLLLFMLLFLVIGSGVWVLAVQFIVTPELLPPTGQVAFYASGGVVLLTVLLLVELGIRRLQREVLRVRADKVILEMEWFGMETAHRSFPRDQVTLRVVPVARQPWGWNTILAFWRVGGGTLALDSAGQTFHFGIGLDETEAHRIVAAIGSHPTARDTLPGN
jgi:hypothetical protein